MTSGFRQANVCAAPAGKCERTHSYPFPHRAALSVPAGVPVAPQAKNRGAAVRSPASSLCTLNLMQRMLILTPF